MRRTHLNALLVGGLLAALLAGIALSRFLSGGDSLVEGALVLDSPRAIPDFALQRAGGGDFDKAYAEGRWQLAFFGFTHCPDICPSTLAKMKQLRAQLPQSLQEQLEFVFVTVDPERDGPDVMRDYIAHFDPAITGVTGSLPAIEDFAASVGIAFIKVDDENGDYSMDHSTALVLLNPQTRIQAYFSAPHDIDQLQAALQQLIRT